MRINNVIMLLQNWLYLRWCNFHSNLQTNCLWNCKFLWKFTRQLICVSDSILNLSCPGIRLNQNLVKITWHKITWFYSILLKLLVYVQFKILTPQQSWRGGRVNMYEFLGLSVHGPVSLLVWQSVCLPFIQILQPTTSKVFKTLESYYRK